MVPVFVSVGGGDGEGLDYLLRNSRARLGVLVEYARPLADIARRRSVDLPDKKQLLVIEGDAQERIGEAIAIAHEAVATGREKVVVVTCHAVLHELDDRGPRGFDPLGFFGTIFQHRILLLFSHIANPEFRRTGPRIVLLKANCSLDSLLGLAGAITSAPPIPCCSGAEATNNWRLCPLSP